MINMVRFAFFSHQRPQVVAVEQWAYVNFAFIKSLTDLENNYAPICFSYFFFYMQDQSEDFPHI